MKRLIIFMFAIGLITTSSTALASMSKSKVRKEARFLTDKMSYELDLSAGQRNDTYEINYDFIYSVRDLMDDVLHGHEWAMNRYYDLLDMRNDDLRWVLSDKQFRKFMQVDYFYRPITASGNNWSFRIYFTYTRPNHFFFGKPSHYTSYHFGNHRRDYKQASNYRNRYKHGIFEKFLSVRDNKVFNVHRTSDFGNIRLRPDTNIQRGETKRKETTIRKETEKRKETGNRKENTSRKSDNTNSRPGSNRGGSNSSGSARR